MDKISYADVGVSCGGDLPIHFLRPEGEKVASDELLSSEVQDFLAGVEPDDSTRYLLVNAMGAHEYWGANSNNDAWPEAGLCYLPTTWTGKPVYDRTLSTTWPYGLPTFYNGHAFAHHVNKDPKKKVGEIVYSNWNDQMKRVELVMRVTKELLQANNGGMFWEMLERGEFPAVSMGSRVPWDRCFPAGTLVRAEGGHRPIESLKVGERVLTHEGRLRPITRAMSRIATTRLLDVVGLPVLRVTDEHPLFVIRKGGVRACRGSSRGMKPGHRFDRGSSVCRRCGKDVELTPKWVEAKDVAEGDYVASLAGRKGPTQATHLPPFLVGAWLGDGFCIRSTKDSNAEGISFSFGKRKEGVLRQVEAELAEMGFVTRVYDRDTSWVVNTYSQPLAEELEGKFGRGSSGKRLPDEAFFWPDPAKRALLEGYIQTDGHTDEGGVVRIASINRGLLLDFRELLLSLGIPATLQKQPTRVSGFVSVSPVFHLRFNWTTTAPRAHGFFHGSYYFSPVASNKGEEADTEVFNLSVEEDESYIAEGLVTHNCSNCQDLEEFFRALATYNSQEHAHPGIAVLRYHERMMKERGHGIRGIARRPAEYCDCMRYRAGQIDSRTGIKIFVFNDFPRFFDQSLVKRGADKTAYTMVVIGKRRGHMKVAFQLEGHSLSDAMRKFAPPYHGTESMFSAERATHGATLAEAHRNRERFSNVALPKVAALEYQLDRLILGEQRWTETPLTEAMVKESEASFEEEAFRKRALARKRAEMDKDVEGKVTAVSRGERDLPHDMLNDLAKHPLEESLGTCGAMGIVLRPREFTRIVLRRHAPGTEDMADALQLPERPSPGPMSLRFLPELLSKILPSFGDRSGFDAPLSDRILVLNIQTQKKASASFALIEASLPPDFLTKLGSLYQSYRDGLMNFLPCAQTVLSEYDTEGKIAFVHAPPPEDLFTPLSYAYLRKAFLEELSR